MTKTDGSGITTFDILWNNSGLVQSQSGTICFNRNSTLNGGNYLTKGGKISYGVNATVTVTGAITNLVACDVFVVGLSNITQTAYLTNCEISTSETVIGNVYLIHGTIDSNSSLTVATNGVLNLNCSDISLYINGPFTNKGVVNWMDGDIKVVKDSFGNCGCIQNMECATWNIQCNCGIWVASGSEKFNNSGTVTKTDGSGITTFDILWNNSGLVQSQSGTICFNRNSTLNGGNYLTKGGKISYGVNATVTVTGAITNLVACDVFVVGLSNITQTAYLTNCEISTSETVIGNVYLIHGTIDSNSSLTVATNGVLNLNCSDISLYINGPFTNKGVVNWMDGDIKVVKDSFGNCGCIQNMECATWNIQCNCGIWAASGSEKFNNSGTVTKTDESGTTTIGVAFSNTGTLNVQQGCLSLAGNTTLSGGKLNIGISSLVDYGTILLNNTSAAGTIGATLLNGYIPAKGSIFRVVNYDSLNSIFRTTALPFGAAWQTNYGINWFSLEVLNARPVLLHQTNQVINELTPLYVTNTVTDADMPNDTLTYKLVVSPDGASIGSNGVITWTPSEAQGPSTNIFITVVTDNGTPALSATNSFIVFVNEVNSAPIFDSLANTNFVINPGKTLEVIMHATDADIPKQILTYSLIEGPPDSKLDSTSGYFTWRSASSRASTTNWVTVAVSDNGTPSLSAKQSFQIIVNATKQPTIEFVKIVSGYPALSINGPNDPDYIILTSTNLVDWTSIANIVSPTNLPFQWIDTNSISDVKRFYRVRLFP